MNTNKSRLYKVKPVAPIPDSTAKGSYPNGWDLPEGHYGYSAEKARKVLKVRHVFPSRIKDVDPSPQDSLDDFFYIDVPKHFFAENDSDSASKGDFIATPRYKETDVLVVQWTGYGKFSGWIDTNVQMRGAGIGTVIEQGGVACAKWS